MRHILTLRFTRGKLIKGVILLVAAMMLLAASAIYATHLVSDVNKLTGNVLVSTTGDNILVFSAGGTPINSGDSLNFGTVDRDDFGRSPVPVRGPFEIKNDSTGPLLVFVTGDGGDQIVPLFGPTAGDLKPAFDNVFRLEAPGVTGDTVSGYLGLRIPPTAAGTKSTTILFRATDPGPSRIAFASTRDGTGDTRYENEIYMMDADGSNPTRLTNNLSYDFGPAWSPDGTRIAFHSEREGFAEIYVMTRYGTDQTNLTNSPFHDYYPDWSPDGSRIAFASHRHGNWEIYVMTSTGDQQTRLTTHSSTDYWPSWSPDGSKIAFYTSRAGPNEIYTMNADGTGLLRLTDVPESDLYPAWSPTNLIAFNSYRDGNWEIYLMNTNGTNQKNLTNNSTGDDLFPAWSPDGSKIAFQSNRDGAYEVYVMNADGTGQTRLTLNTGDTDGQPAWSPGIVP